jgi:hypothetical protein
MKTISTTQFVGAGVFFLLILLSGYWLSRSGKPYSTIVFTIHKLISLAAVVLFGIIVYRVNRGGTLSTTGLLAAIVAGMFFLGTMVTGGLLSIPIDNPMPAIVHKLHQVTPYLTVLSTAVTLYLLSRR